MIDLMGEHANLGGRTVAQQQACDAIGFGADADEARRMRFNAGGGEYIEVLVAEGDAHRAAAGRGYRLQMQ